ncbi:hypothetical protein ACWHA3_12510 [Streptomyces cyaneofuscatus]
MAREELTRLTDNGNGNGTCGKDDCPNVYRTPSGSFVIQGDVSDAFAAPDGEGLVRGRRPSSPEAPSVWAWPSSAR